MHISRQKILSIGHWLNSKRPHRPTLASRSSIKLADLWILSLRLLASAAITTGIIFGAKETYFAVGSSQIFGADVDADLKLATLGFINKILDVILVSSLEYTAAIVVTIWMARKVQRSNANGATYLDFDLKDELTKPWMTLLCFFTRFKRSGWVWNWKSLFRCLFCLCISISVMLQGLAVNTLAVPKERWFPNYLHSWKLTKHMRDSMTVELPKVHLQAVAWYNLLGVGQSNVGRENYPPWDWALGLSASYSFSGLTHVVSTVGRAKKSWQGIYRMAMDGDSNIRWTALNTAFDFSNRPVETISADDGQVSELFQWLRKVDHRPSASSVGWTGNLTIVVPALNTVCQPAAGITPGETFNVTIPSNVGSGADPTFSMNIGPVKSIGFTGATCSVTFRQALYPVNFWIVRMQGADISFNGYGNDWNKFIRYEPTIATDYDIIRALAIQTRDSLPRLEPMVQSASLVNHFLLMSRMLQKTDNAISSDTAGLSIVIGTLVQNILSTSSKYRSTLPSTLPSRPEDKVTSYPLQWQLYGSGPRLAWEWISVLVLLVVFTSYLFGMYQTLLYWTGPGFWTELGGMMRLAQASPKLKDIEDENKARKRMYRVKRDTGGETILESN